MRSAAITVVWRRLDETLLTLDSILAMHPAPDITICVAQQLDDAELATLRSWRPDHLRVIAVDENLGFSKAVNMAMEAVAAEVEAVLVVNNDATVDKRCLGMCLEEMVSDPLIAVVGPAIAFTDRPDLLWYGGGRHSNLFAFTQHRGLNRPSKSPPPSGDTEYVPGCCALYSVRAWRAVGSFREDFFMYYEDAEWGSRARARGWRLRYLGMVLCHHAVGVSSRQRGSLGLSDNTAYYLARNPLRYALDTPSAPLRLGRVFGLLTIWNGYNLWRVLQARRRSVGRAYLAGLSDAVRGRMGPRRRGPSVAPEGDGLAGSRNSETLS